MSDWDLDIRPHLTPYFAYGAAALILVAHIAIGALLKISSTGVIFQTADQVAIALLGVVIACAVLLFARPRLGIDVHPRGAPEDLDLQRKSVYEVTLFDLLRAYGQQRARKDSSVLHIAPVRLYSMEEAVQRQSSLLGRMPDRATLARFLPGGEGGGLLTRSALAAHFAATLELAKAGRVELRQEGAFAPLYVRGRSGDSQGGDNSEEAQSHD